MEPAKGFVEGPNNGEKFQKYGVVQTVMIDLPGTNGENEGVANGVEEAHGG